MSVSFLPAWISSIFIVFCLVTNRLLNLIYCRNLCTACAVCTALRDGGKPRPPFRERFKAFDDKAKEKYYNVEPSTCQIAVKENKIPFIYVIQLHSNKKGNKGKPMCALDDKNVSEVMSRVLINPNFVKVGKKVGRDFAKVAKMFGIPKEDYI